MEATKQILLFTFKWKDMQRVRWHKRKHNIKMKLFHVDDDLIAIMPIKHIINHELSIISAEDELGDLRLFMISLNKFDVEFEVNLFKLIGSAKNAVVKGMRQFEMNIDSV